MTRWWAYATLALAIVCGSVPMRDSAPRTSGGESLLVEQTPASSGALRKRTGKHKPIARRDASGSCPFAIADYSIDLAPPRIAIVVETRPSVARVEADPVHASARAPPRS